VIPKHALDRDPTNGFRLVLSFDEEVKLEALRYSISPGTRRDYRTEEPVSDAEFEVFRRLYAYDPYPLDAVVERVDTFEHWVREVAAFDVPYGERGGAILYLPRNGMEPFHPILYWGGSNIYSTRTVDDGWTEGFDYMVRAGRVVVIPLFKGAYGRSMPPPGEGDYGQEYESSAFRDATIEWVKDLSATVDYIEERADLDKDRVGYFGFSHGGMEAPIVMAIEERVKASVTNVGGFYSSYFFPEADPFNFVSRARSPLLMINGKYDIVFQYETQQLPMFEGLGTPEQDKKHYTAEAGHLVPKDEIISETLAWFDKYLGVPGGG
jgi:predicted esterase